MIEIESLHVSKRGKTICRVPDLRVSRGQRLAVCGSNGSGKSTLLRVVAGLEPNYEGRCVLADRQQTTYVEQSPIAFRGSVLANVVYGLRARRWRRPARERAAQVWLERLGLADVINETAGNLSGGEKRRMALARALVLEPKLLLLDEPFADLDEAGIRTVVDVLADIADLTLLVASPQAPPPGTVEAAVLLESNECNGRDASML